MNPFRSWWWVIIQEDFPDGSGDKDSYLQCRDTGDVGLIPGSGKSPGGGSGNPLQYSCLQDLMDRGAWRATVHGVAKNQTRLRTVHNIK